jgi:hypothetical protein
VSTVAQAGKLSVGLLLSLTLVTAGCEDPLAEFRAEGGALGAPGGAKSPKGESAATPGDQRAARAEPYVYTEEDFAELETENRDPFRPYARAFKAQAATPAQRRVLMPGTSLEEMNLIAIVTGVSQPRAMVTDTAQVGHVISRGDYIGRAEVVQSGGAEGIPVTLNWRVDSIRPGSVLLTREDPTSPDKPPLTRVIPMHERR